MTTFCIAFYISPVFLRVYYWKRKGGWQENKFCLHKRRRRLLPVQLRHGGQGRQAYRAAQRGQEPCLQACNRSRTFGSEISQYTVNCKEYLIYLFLFWDFAALVPISTFTCLWAACSTQQGKSHLCILFLGIVRRQSQFPCVCVWFIFSQDQSTYFPVAE